MKGIIVVLSMFAVVHAEQCRAPDLENGVVIAEQNLKQNSFTGTFR